MAVPKKKVSRSRRNMRRFAAGNKLDAVTAVICPKCSEPVRPHRVCAEATDCGMYQAAAQPKAAKKAKVQPQAGV